MSSPAANSRRRGGIFVLCLALAFLICFCGWYVWFGPNQNGKGTAVSSGERNAAAEIPGDPKSKQAGNNSEAQTGEEQEVAVIWLNHYSAYLDQICPHLTRDEVLAVAARCGNDPKVLMGLVAVGTEDRETLIQLALNANPDDALIHLTILRLADTKFDKLKSARALIEALPDDAEPRYLAAVELLASGNHAAAMEELKKATAVSGYGTLRSALQEAQVSAYELAGRNRDAASVRTILSDTGTGADVALVRLKEMLGITAANFRGNEEIAALMLDAAQKAVYAPNASIRSYTNGRIIELEYLTEFLRDTMTNEAPSAGQKYLPEGASKTFADAQTEFDDLNEILSFSQDMPGIYKRLDEEQRSKFIDLVQTRGELEAYKWALEVRPNLFRSPNFKPQGITKSNWLRMIGQK